MRLGVHVSIAGGLAQAAERATRLGCTAVQIFSRSPRGGPAPHLADEEIARFRQGLQTAKIAPLAVHAPYILNLAAPDPMVYRRSLAMYREEYVRCHRIGAGLLVTHVGSHKGEGEAAGLMRVVEALDRTLEALDSPVLIALENTAGSGQGLGYQFEQLAAMRTRVRQPHRVGICLDTAHLFASGYPIHTAEGLEQTVEQCERALGWQHVKLIHLNDSKSAFGSRVDRHWHIGEGLIGAEAMRRVVTHPRLSGVPMILETPKNSDEDDLRNLARVRAFAAEAGRGPAAVHGLQRDVVSELHDFGTRR